MRPSSTSLPALHPRHVQHQRNAVDDAPADNLPGEIPGLHRAAGEPGESGRRVVRVNGGKGTAVARVERLEQVGGFGAADLAYDDVIRPMPERVFHRVANRHAPGTELPGLEADAVRVIDPELQGVLDRDDALIWPAGARSRR